MLERERACSKRFPENRGELCLCPRFAKGFARRFVFDRFVSMLRCSRRLSVPHGYRVMANRFSSAGEWYWRCPLVLSCFWSFVNRLRVFSDVGRKKYNGGWLDV